MSIVSLAVFGGLFAVLVGLHFVADWPFQSQKEAMAKAKDWKVRAWHCVKYTVAFWPLFLLVDFHGIRAGVATVILFLSHFFIDTYWPVMMWAKHLRKVPQFADVVPPVTLSKDEYDALQRGDIRITLRGWSDKEVERITYKNDEEAFKASWNMGINSLLYITMDQLFHIIFLVPVAYLMMQ